MVTPYRYFEWYKAIIDSSIAYDIFISFIGAFLGLLSALLINRLIDKKTYRKEKLLELRKYYSNLNCKLPRK